MLQQSVRERHRDGDVTATVQVHLRPSRGGDRADDRRLVGDVVGVLQEEHHVAVDAVPRYEPRRARRDLRRGSPETPDLGHALHPRKMSMFVISFRAGCQLLLLVALHRVRNRPTDANLETDGGVFFGSA